jgi:hypothetical protein
MGNNFLFFNLRKTEGVCSANRHRQFIYTLAKHYGIPENLRNRMRTWSMNHVIQLINSYNGRIVIIT